MKVILILLLKMSFGDFSQCRANMISLSCMSEMEAFFFIFIKKSL